MKQSQPKPILTNTQLQFRLLQRVAYFITAFKKKPLLTMEYFLQIT